MPDNRKNSVGRAVKTFKTFMKPYSQDWNA
jgi:hypothetical protein